MKKAPFIAFLSIFIMNAAFSASGLAGVTAAVDDMCRTLTEMLPIVSMLMVIAAGVIYASGQLMGAETRARATTWATAMMLGAVIGILIVVVAPPVLTKIYGCAIECGVTGMSWNPGNC